MTDWSQLEGAYGRCVADGGPTDVGAALEVLASAKDIESDAWLDAMDVFQGHVWHQGTTYPVTAVALPHVMRLACERPFPQRRELAVLAAWLTTALGSDVPGIPLDALCTWFDDERADALAACAVVLPDLRRRWLAKLEASGRVPTAAECVALASMHVPDSSWPQLRAAVFGEDPRLRVAAAVLVSRMPALDEATRVQLDRVFVPGAQALLAFDVPLPIPPIPAASFGAAASLQPATVLFVGERLTTLRAGARNVTVRRALRGLRKGDPVLVALHPSGQARVVEWNGGRVELDREGALVER